MTIDGNNELATITWVKEFLGIGYSYHDHPVQVFPLFEDQRYATGLWKKTFETLHGNQIKIRFVEYEYNYWFIAYTTDLESNIGLVNNFAISESYYNFKDLFEEKVVLRFGIYKVAGEREKRKTNKNYHLDLMKKSKLVEDVKFMKYSELPPSSLERRLIEANASSKDLL